MDLFQIAGLTWQAKDLNTVLPLFLLTLFFILYWFTSKSDRVRDFFYRKYGHDQASVNHIAFNRIFGFLMLGVVPGMVCLCWLKGFSLADYGLTIKPGTGLFILTWSLLLAGVVVLLSYFSASKPSNLENYPQIRAREWTRITVLVNGATWALYLLGYEFLFRGLLLFPLAEQMGVWPAIAVNTALYSATHIPKGLNEAVGAIVLGMVLCLFTLASGSIWIAFFVHLAMAWTNSFASLKFHPDMHFRKK